MALFRLARALQRRCFRSLRTRRRRRACRADRGEPRAAVRRAIRGDGVRHRAEAPRPHRHARPRSGRLAGHHRVQADEPRQRDNQGLFYLDWLMDHRGDFEIAARSGWASVEVAWTARVSSCWRAIFNRYDQYAVNRIDERIELWTYTLYDDDLLSVDLLSRGGARAPRRSREPGSTGSRSRRRSGKPATTSSTTCRR